nr:hypothetical protein [Bacillus pumilus]
MSDKRAELKKELLKVFFKPLTRALTVNLEEGGVQMEEKLNDLLSEVAAERHHLQILLQHSMYLSQQDGFLQDLHQEPSSALSLTQET